MFVTFFGTIRALGYSVLGAYALSKKKAFGTQGLQLLPRIHYVVFGRYNSSV